MNFFAFALAAWVCAGLEIALQPVLDAGSSGVRPSFLIPLIVFVALHAETRPALWAALSLGLFVDLIKPVAMLDGGSAILPGLHALGFLLAAHTTLTLRGLVIRRNPVTLVVLSVFASIIASVTVVALMGLRTIGDDPLAWRGAAELIPRFWSALYTALSALVLGLPLFAAAPLFGFPHAHTPQFARRG